MVVMGIGILELLPSIELLLSLVVAYVINLSIMGSPFAKHGDILGEVITWRFKNKAKSFK